jgi:RHS repeat-associated protein
VGNLTELTTAKADGGGTPASCNGGGPPLDCETTRYAYDEINRLAQETYPDHDLGKDSREFTYDKASNLIQRIDQKNAATQYDYDDLHRLIQRDYAADPDDSFAYDTGGRMISALRNGWLATYSYDSANRVLSATQNGQTVGYAYDIPNRKRTLAYPSGKLVVEQRDLRERLDTLNAGVIADYAYDLGNRATARVYGNGAQAAYSYNANNWITQLVHTQSDTTLIAGFAHDYDQEGNKRFEEKQHDAARSEAYGYDDIHRLIDYKVGTLIGASVSVPGTQTQYDLDKLGNWDSKTKDLGSPETRQHNAVNEITAIALAPISSDDNGNLVEDSDYLYTYDQENRLAQIKRKSDGKVVGQYRYDALSRRIAKIADPSFGPPTPLETRYFYDNARIIEEQDAGAATQAVYTYGNYIDEVLTMERDTGGSPAFETYYYHQNALWSVAAISDDAQAVVERYAYDAYGKATITDGSGTPMPPNAWGTPHSAIGNPWLFTGRQLDEEAGLYFYRARHYDSEKGRFMQRDTLGYVDGGNLYEYVKGNPTRWTDPEGQLAGDFFTCCVCCLCGFERSDIDRLLRALRTASTGVNVALTAKVPVCGVKIPSKVVQELSLKLGTKIGEQATKKLCATATGIGAIVWAYDIGKCGIQCEGELRRDNLGPLKPPNPERPVPPAPSKPTVPRPEPPTVPRR